MSHCTYQGPVLQKCNSFFDVDVGSPCSVKLTHSSSIGNPHHIFKNPFGSFRFKERSWLDYPGSLCKCMLTVTAMFTVIVSCSLRHEKF